MQEPADPQLDRLVRPFPELSWPQQESSHRNTENQAKKRRVPTIQDNNFDEDFYRSSPKHPHAKVHLTSCFEVDQSSQNERPKVDFSLFVADGELMVVGGRNEDTIGGST